MQRMLNNGQVQHRYVVQPPHVAGCASRGAPRVDARAGGHEPVRPHRRAGQARSTHRHGEHQPTALPRQQAGRAGQAATVHRQQAQPVHQAGPQSSNLSPAAPMALLINTSQPAAEAAYPARRPRRKEDSCTGLALVLCYTQLPASCPTSGFASLLRVMPAPPGQQAVAVQATALRFNAALISRSCAVPQAGQHQARTDSGSTSRT